MKRWSAVSVLMVAIAGCGIEGLHNANPKLSMRFNPSSRAFEVTSNRDDEVQIKNLQVETPSAKVGVESASFTGNASSVREANRVQMEGMALQGATAWAGASQLVGAFGDVLAEVMPYVPATVASRALGKLPKSYNLNTPYGGFATTSGFSDAQISALMQLAGRSAGPPTPTATPAATQAATQPAGE